MFYLLFTSQLKLSESTSPLFPTASLIQRPVSLSTRESLVNSYETMTENIRGSLVYKLMRYTSLYCLSETDPSSLVRAQSLYI